MRIGHFPKKRAVSPIVDYSSDGKRYPEMKRNGFIDGDIKINRIDLRGHAIVEVRHVDSPSQIWVRLANHISDELIIKEPYELERVRLNEHNSHILLKDQYYMAPWDSKERSFARVRVLDAIPIGKSIYAQVIYIDAGITRWVDAKCLAVMPVPFHYHPWQAICLSLADLEKVSFGRHYGEYDSYWDPEECEIFRNLINEYTKFEIRVLMGSVFRNDYREPIKVEMYGIDETEQAKLAKLFRKKSKGQSITCLFAARSRGRVRYIEVDDASLYPIVFTRPIEPECDPATIPPFLKGFPSHWIHKVEIEQPLIVPREEWDTWTFDKARVPICDVQWLDKNGFKDAFTNSYWVCVEGLHTVSPYEWYGRPIKRVKKKFTVEERAEVEEKMRIANVQGDPDDQGELGDITMSMLNADTDLKNLAEHLDAFYALGENRFSLDSDKIKERLRNGDSVYAVTCCTEERARYTGEWQRVEVCRMTNHAEVRYLDSGGRELVAAGNLYRMHPRHASYPPLCVQFCMHGICDPDPEYQKKFDFSKERKSAFRSCLRVDVPLLIDILAQPYRGAKRPADHVYKDDHVLYAYRMKYMGDSQLFIHQLEKLRPKHRLQEDPLHPIGRMNFGVDAIVVCGPCGAGKSSVGLELARQLGWIFKDGDDFHGDGNRDKMRLGTALTDEDRFPWLDLFVQFWRTCHVPVVFACSALKRSYRQRLRSMKCRFLLLDVDRTLLEERLTSRSNHFMPRSLLDSQLQTLEMPRDDESDVLTIPIRDRHETPSQIARKSQDLLGI